MAKGRSLHIGLNYVDPKHYDGWDGQLNGCLNDARDMKAIAEEKGFTAVKLHDDEATLENVVAEIKKAASELKTGDKFFLTYSGHGGQVGDSGMDGWDPEPDGLDETWCLWNRQLIDDELYLLFSEFAKGVRLFVMSDSCNSGSVIRHAAPVLKAAMAVAPVPVPAGAGAAPPNGMPLIRGMDEVLADRVFQKNKAEYVEAKETAVKASKGRDLGCQALLISGCQDNQTSSDGPGNGLFTSAFLQVWNKGKFNGSYKRLHTDILKKMPLWQAPNFFAVGADLKIEKGKVLVI